MAKLGKSASISWNFVIVTGEVCVKLGEVI